eukprot:3155221-Pleurochrysis_carterae.AAC.2
MQLCMLAQAFARSMHAGVSSPRTSATPSFRQQLPHSVAFTRVCATAATANAPAARVPGWRFLRAASCSRRCARRESTGSC